MPYPVFKVPPENVLESEQLGTKDKFWFRGGFIDSSVESEWLFKFPTEGTGQHWAEKIAYEIAREMRISAPRVELAEFGLTKGSATVSFTKANGYELYHGNQILHGFDSKYEQTKRFRHKAHTVGRIFEAIIGSFRDKKASDRACTQMAGYLVLDALICNVDRHHENWGVVRKRKGEGWLGRLAPSYDHASSLGRELNDTATKKNRERYLRELGVEKYIERGRSPIFITGNEKHGLAPMELIKSCLKIQGLSQFFEDGIERLHYLNSAKFERIISKFPPGWMSELEKEFAITLLIKTLEQLNHIQK